MWPLTPLTAYVPGTTPWIKAADLNAIQSAINSLYAGTQTVKTLYADGTGGNPLTQLPGLLVASALVTSTFTPAPVNYNLGTVGRGSVPLGWAFCYSYGGVARGYNVYSGARVSAGSYEVIFTATPSIPDRNAPLVTPFQTTAPVMCTASPGVSGGRQLVQVHTWDKNGNPYDSGFFLVVFGE